MNLLNDQIKLNGRIELISERGKDNEKGGREAENER